MRIFLLLIASFIVIININAQVFPVDTILDNGTPEKRIKFVFLSDGYQENELATYITQVQAIKDSFLLHSPFKEYRNFFNFYAIQVPSVESGADHPGTASDESVFNPQPVLEVNTYFNSSFDISGIHRALSAQNIVAINSVLSSNRPDYDQAYILVNTHYYGGSGGYFPTGSINVSSAHTAMHEFGHNFANLADEYTVVDVSERPNHTSNNDPATIKWKNWLGDNGIGIYPTGYANWQRPHETCKMRYLSEPFCSVCAEAFINKIYSLVTPIYSYLPANSMVTVNAPTTFSANLTLPQPNTLTTDWQLNGISIASSTDSITIIPGQLSAGDNLLTLFVTDQTNLSRSYWPNAGYVFSQTWTINGEVSAIENIGKSDKFYYQISPNPTSDLLTISGNLDYATDLGVEIYSETGTQIYQQKIAVQGDYEHTIDIRKFSNGIYTVLLRLTNGFSIKKQIVKAQ